MTKWLVKQLVESSVIIPFNVIIYMPNAVTLDYQRLGEWIPILFFQQIISVD